LNKKIYFSNPLLDRRVIVQSKVLGLGTTNNFVIVKQLSALDFSSLYSNYSRACSEVNLLLLAIIKVL